MIKIVFNSSILHQTRNDGLYIVSVVKHIRLCSELKYYHVNVRLTS